MEFLGIRYSKSTGNSNIFHLEKLLVRVIFNSIIKKKKKKILNTGKQILKCERLKMSESAIILLLWIPEYFYKKVLQPYFQPPVK